MKWIDNLKLREKSIIIVVVSIFIPMILTNIFFFHSIELGSRIQQRAEMNNSIRQIEYDIKNSVQGIISIADYLNRMEGLDKFLKEKYSSNADYYKAYNELMENETIQYYYTAQSTEGITIFTDNPTIVNGTYFINKSAAIRSEWYQALISSGRDYIVCNFYEDGNTGGYIRKGRHFAVIQKMNYYGGDNLIMLDLDYGQLQKSIKRICGTRDGYFCDREGNVIVSSEGKEDVQKPFRSWKMIEKSGEVLEKDCEIYGDEFKLYIIDKSNTWSEMLGKKKYILFAIYIFDLILPVIVMYIIYNSINKRLAAVGENIEKIKTDCYEEIGLEPSRDELGMIIQSYNLMVARIRELIETVYKNKEREQELLLAKKQAELHALQSQINPHFMFNALESIRMHSLIKDENETAKILENFSILLRETIQWNSDSVTVSQECRNVQRYLEIQKYRFGERLEFSVSVQEECNDVQIPKFSIVTFVENACIHGIERSLMGGNISVVVSKDEGLLYIEIMNSGRGMSEDKLADLKDRIANADIRYIESASRSIGIVNTVIRLKQAYGESLIIDINSSETGGTEVCIVMPVN